MPRLGPVLERAALLVLGVALALGLVEAGLRLWRPPPHAMDLRGLHEFRPDRPWLYGLRAGAEGRTRDTGEVVYRVNPDGFRGPRAARPKPQGRVRILVLGDSVAFGYAVEEADAFPRVLEAELAARFPESRFEVVNLGVGGYNAWNEAQLLRDVGLAYQPDVVLVQFCINDLNDPTLHFDAQTRLALDAIPDAAFPDPARRRGPAHTSSPLRVACARSLLCKELESRWLAWRASEFDEAARRAAGDPVERASAPEWGWLEARYREMADASAEVGARFAVLAFPYRAQLDGRGMHPVQARLHALAADYGWPLVDPLPAFRARASGPALFVDWWHPSPAGHRVAARETLRALACAGALGEAPRAACAADEAGLGG